MFGKRGLCKEKSFGGGMYGKPSMQGMRAASCFALEKILGKKSRANISWPVLEG